MRILAPLAVLLLLGSAASAEVFVLADGGRVTGSLLNPKESPRKQYVIQADDGAKLTFAAAQVRKVLRPKPDEAEYERIAPTYADTAAAQWELAQWCREHKLTLQRQVHLRRVIELEPNNVAARHALGYSRVNGEWATQKEAMAAAGFVLKGGKWLLPQELKLAEDKRQLDAAQQEWCQKLKRWRGWLGTKRDQEARDNIAAINDPMAVKGLALGLRNDADAQARVMFVAALGRIDAAEAARAMAIASIYDSEEEVRLTCLDQLQTKRRPEVTSYYVTKLTPKKNTNDIINLAALGLGRLKDPAAIPALIDALATTHRFKVQKPGGDGATSASFGHGPNGGGTGMSSGGGPQYIYRTFNNQTVLDALVATTGLNFAFDKQAWWHWYRSQKKKPESLDARRDSK
jgi:hypothetical protein